MRMLGKETYSGVLRIDPLDLVLTREFAARMTHATIFPDSYLKPTKYHLIVYFNCDALSLGNKTNLLGISSEDVELSLARKWLREIPASIEAWGKGHTVQQVIHADFSTSLKVG